MQIGLSPCNFVLDGDPAFPSQKGGRSPHQFSAHVYCGQMAGWIKMALGMEVDLYYCGQTAVCIRIPFGTEVGLSLDWVLSQFIFVYVCKCMYSV